MSPIFVCLTLADLGGRRSMWNNVINAWWPLVFYPATDAPRFTKGMWAMIGTALATLAVTALVYALERREHRQTRAVRDDDEGLRGPDGPGNLPRCGQDRRRMIACPSPSMSRPRASIPPAHHCSHFAFPPRPHSRARLARGAPLSSS